MVEWRILKLCSSSQLTITHWWLLIDDRLSALLLLIDNRLSALRLAVNNNCRDLSVPLNTPTNKRDNQNQKEDYPNHNPSYLGCFQRR